MRHYRSSAYLRLAELKTKPRNYKAAFKMMQRRLQTFKTLIEDIISRLSSNQEAKENAEDFLGKGILSDMESIKHWFEKVEHEIQTGFELWDNISNVSAKEGVKVFIAHLKDAKHAMNTLSKLIGHIESWDQLSDMVLSQDVASIQLIRDISLSLPFASKELAQIFIYEGPFEEWERRMDNQGRSMWERHRALPKDIEPVERLYHASVNAKQIAESGFQSDVPGMGGIGGAQSTMSGKVATSFTADLYTAKELMRSMKEAAMLMQGEWKLDSFLQTIEETPGGKEALRTFEVQRKRRKPETKEELFDLYRMYLTFAKDRYNPVYFGDLSDFVKTFEEADYSNIGVVIAKVDMTNEDIDYLEAMEEYRVPPEAIISIDGIID